MAKVKKGDRLVCVPCGREVTVGYGGIGETTLWCCGQPMGQKKKGKATSSRTKEKKARK